MKWEKTYVYVICGNSYKHMSSLCKHKKTCSIKVIEYDTYKKNKEEDMKYQDKLDNLTKVVLDVVSKNSELTKQIIDK